MKTTLDKIRACSPCGTGWKKLLTTLGKTQADDEEVRFLTILESNNLDDALWCLRSTPEYDRDYRLFAVWCARQVQRLLNDQRSLDAIDVAERFANGEASSEELAAARDAAWAAAWDAGAAWDARDAGAARAAWAAVADWAAGAAGAAWAAARAARDAAWDTARDPALDAGAARDAARDAQKAMFILMCNGAAPWQVAGGK